MNTAIKSALLLAVLVATPVAKASADTVPGWYAGAGVGVNRQDDIDVNTSFIPADGGGPTNASDNFEFHTGFDVDGDVGYAYDNGIRAEGEIFHSTAAVRNNDGSLNNTDLFANVLYDFNLGSMFVPYVGGGVGVGFVGAKHIGPTTGGGFYVEGNDTKFAYQGIAGVATQLNKDWEITTDYRYIATLDPTFGGTDGTSHKVENNSHNVLVGIRYNFAAPAPVVPAKMVEAPHMQPAAVAKPVVAPVPQTFEVFFDFDKSTLTPEAKHIIAAAADEYKKGDFVRIAVTGHTDTKGTTKHNKGLSERRATAVKAEFASLGVDAGVVATQGVGKKGLLVPTNDQVREAQNRRAEIVLGKK